MAGFEDLGFQEHGSSAGSAGASDPFSGLGFQPQAGQSSDSSAPPADSSSQSPDIYDRLAQIKSGIQNALMKTRGPLAVMANPAVQDVVGKVIDYPFGYLRTGAAELQGMLKDGENPVTSDDIVNTILGSAPGVGDYAARFGEIPKDASVKLPFSNNKSISLQDLANFGGNVAPIVMGDLALRSAPGQAAAAKMGQAASDAGTAVAQKTGKALLNIPEDVTARYVADPASADTAPSRNDIADRIMALKDQSDNQVAKAHDDLQDAKAALTENKSDVRSGQQDEKFQAGQDLNEAQRNFDEKKQQFREALKSNNLTNMSGSVTQAVADLKDKVVQGSKDAYAILDNAKGSVPVQPLVSGMNKWSDDLTVNGVPTSDADADALNQVTAWQSRLQKMADANKGDLTLPQAKQVIQALDRQVQISQDAGGFSPKTKQALSDLRSQIDQAVKTQSPEYAAKMEEVAHQTNLLRATNNLYGTPEKAISNLNSITSQKGQALHVPLLQQLGEETGRDLVSPAQDYIQNHDILTTPSKFDQVIEQIPEAKALRAAQGRMSDLSNPANIRDVQVQSNSPLQQKVADSQAALESAKSDNQVFNGVTRDSVTGKTKQLGGSNDYAAQARFGDIDKKYGTNFQKEIQARNDADAFSKDATRGSRLAVVGGATGGLVGYLLGGHEGAIAGTAAGAEAGAIADRYGGQLFKGAINKTKAVAGIAKTAASDVSGNLSPAAAGSNSSSLISVGKSVPAAASVPKKGEQKWMADGLNNLLQHANDSDKKILMAAPKNAINDLKFKNLLIQAGDLKPGTKAMDNVLSQVKSKLAASPDDEGED